MYVKLKIRDEVENESCLEILRLGKKHLSDSQLEILL